MVSRTMKIAGVVIALFNAVNVVNSTWYFLGMAHFTVPAWLAFNACAPSVLFYLAGYLSRRRWIMTASLPFLLYFGTGGMFVFGWSGTSLYAQVGHIAMTLASMWIIATSVMERKFRLPAAGFAAGLVLFLALFPVQHRYVMSHPDLIKKLGDSTFENFTGGK